MTFKPTLIAALTCLSLFAAGMYWQTQSGTKAPNVSFTTIKGQTIQASDWQGKPTLLTFWATDCPGCIEEIPHLIELHRHYADQGLIIIAVAMSYDPPNHVLAMADSKRLPYAIALDPNAALAHAFGDVQLTPTTFLIDRTGHIIWHKVGVFDQDTMQSKLHELGFRPK